MRALLSAHVALLVAGILTFVMMGAGQSLYGPALPAFARDFGISTAQSGWLISAQWIGSAIGVILMLLVGRHVTPRHAAGVMAAGAALIAIGPGWWGTLAASVIFGTGYGIAASVFNPRVMRAFADHGPSMLSLLNAMFAAGAILAPLAFVWIGSDPRLAFATVAAICALVCLGAGRASAEDAASGTAPTQPFRFRPLILCFAVMGIAIEACLIGLGPTALIRAGAGEADAAQLLSAFFVAFLLARIALVFFAHLVSGFVIYTAAMALTACAALAATILPPGPCFVLMGISAGWFFPGAYVTATRQMGDHPNVAPTILGAGLVGGITSPVIVGALVDGMGSRGFFWLVAAGATFALLAALAVRRRMA